MSSSTERQSQKWHGDGGGGDGEGARDTAVTSQTAEIRKRRTHTHTPTPTGTRRQTGRENKNQPPNQAAERDAGPSSIVCPPPTLGRVPVPATGTPHGQDRGGRGGKMERGGAAKKPEPPWAKVGDGGGWRINPPPLGRGPEPSRGTAPPHAGLGGPCAGLGARPRVGGAERGACREGWGRTRSRPLRILFPTGPGILGAKAKGAIKEGGVGGGAGNVTTAGRGTRLVPGGGPLCFLVPRL